MIREEEGSLSINPCVQSLSLSLAQLAIIHVNQVWIGGITDEPMLQGFEDLGAGLDWHSRYVLA